MINILILTIVWLTSCGISAFVGFFVGFKCWSKSTNKKSTEARKQEVTPQISREQQEYLNMLTYDGTPQEPIDAERR